MFAFGGVDNNIRIYILYEKISKKLKKDFKKKIIILKLYKKSSYFELMKFDCGKFNRNVILRRKLLFFN